MARIFQKQALIIDSEDKAESIISILIKDQRYKLFKFRFKLNYEAICHHIPYILDVIPELEIENIKIRNLLEDVEALEK